MKHTFKYIGYCSLFIIALMISSCTKVIDVDTNDLDPKFVIEGFLTYGETTHQVRITKTLNIDDAQNFPTIDNATVVVIDGNGNPQTFSLVAPGLYQITGYTVQQGMKYTLKVTIDGQEFVAQSTVPQAVTIDEIQTFPFSFGPDTVNAIVPVRLDPSGIANFYQFQLFNSRINDYESGIYIQSDDFNDGNLILQPIFANNIEKADSILVEMYCIDKPVFDYFFALSQNEQGSTPANPTSNFSGGCLGYFSARTKDTMSIVIP